MRFLVAVSTCLLATSIAFGQENDIHHHNVFFDVGAASPMGTSTDYLKTAPLISFGYGYRLNRWLRADAGLQMAFGAANNSINAVQTNMGTAQGGDHEFMIPLGGRVYLPIPFKRIEASVELISVNDVNSIEAFVKR